MKLDYDATNEQNNKKVSQLKNTILQNEEKLS